MRRPRLTASVIAFGVAGLVSSSCATTSPPADGGRIRVLAAESSWGSIAAQLGGDKVDVESVIANPETDPHDYEPTAADGRAVAEAAEVVENGLGYDPWMAKLVAANRSDGQRVLDVGSLLRLHDGDNPHRWYFPADVAAVIRRITADYQRIDPAHAAYFAARRVAFERSGLAEYHRLLDAIRARFAGTPIGASESIVVGLARAIGLDVVTPRGFLTAISEGTDPTPADTATVHDQVTGHRIEVWVFNSQNSTPDIQTLTRAARSRGIPVTTVTETLVPAGASFQQWQVAQLRRLESALARATGR